MERNNYRHNNRRGPTVYHSLNDMCGRVIKADYELYIIANSAELHIRTAQ